MSRYLLLALLLAVVPGAPAQMQVEVIPLQHRTADDVIPVLRPLLAPGGALTGMDNQLVVKTTPENLAEIQSLLAAIDRRLRRLLISVTQDIDETRTARESSVSGRYDSGSVDVESGTADRRRGTSVTVGEEDGDHLRYGVRDRDVRQSDRGDYTVQTVEGQAAFIEAGQSLPVPQRNVYVDPRTVVVQDTVEYHDAVSGFYVLPRLSGDTVDLIVSPYMTRVQPGRLPVFDVQSAETTVSGRLGQWIQLGGVDLSSERSGRRNLESHSSRSSESRSMYIRVEEIP